ncbi:MAG TPA: Asp-tRNA(Asn)/Glu-tRNA(Gln) amidotransferase subunit GatC [Usitatibacter sp.]|jgi:aspartyl-tRNA(Asn)/glutamyl-tRNA(Gln) amidotransferase subunit C|nr:Asp-tRNA(Asn)/Glu-tRNA(Gln) amidotransferase subunit GatC [Usitatibacter sp.]HEX3097890.1 Asp-tRNA(Asn)/Glu-tRNA(Gln) amidotransferase subunit GatC [Usitatibacter sp.]
MLSEDQVARIAELARLELTPAEAAAVREQLNGILAMIDEMKAVDTAGVEPMSHPQSAMQRLREDRAGEEEPREAFQAIAPATEDGLYLVPKVIE